MANYYAACTLGLEEALAKELVNIGASDVQQRRGACSFVCEPATAYAVCLWSRVAVRVQEQLVTGRVEGKEDLYWLASQVDWSRSIGPSQNLAIDGSVRDSFANDTRYPVLVVKDAICDQFRKRSGARPDVQRERPDLPVKLVLQGDEAILYRELGGEPLHKRGYRAILHKSPLNEATAAGLLLLTDWDRKEPLCDPMCGSATFLVEAAWIATDRAPGLGRSFAFERWRDTDKAGWQRVYDEAEARATRGQDNLPVLTGNDRHPGALSIAERALAGAGLVGKITLQRGDVRDFVPPAGLGMVVTNPPYGERLEPDPERLADSWRSLGNFLHERCGGARAYVLCGDPELPHLMGLRASLRIPVRNGPIDCRWLRYEIDRR